MSVSLETVAEIIERLGGPTAVGRLVGRSVQSVVNWRASGKFPADTFLILDAELKRRNVAAPPSLWGMLEREGVAS